MSSGDHEFTDADIGNWENCFMIPTIGQADYMRVDPLSHVIYIVEQFTFEIAVGVEWELVLEEEQGNVV